MVYYSCIILYRYWSSDINNKNNVIFYIELDSQGLTPREWQIDEKITSFVARVPSTTSQSLCRLPINFYPVVVVNQLFPA